MGAALIGGAMWSSRAADSAKGPFIARWAMTLTPMTARNLFGFATNTALK